MSEPAAVSFYHLTSTPLERALPRLVEKAYSAGHRVLLVESTPEKREILNQVLWTYSTLTFLPHGTSEEESPELQPILLAPSIEFPLPRAGEGQGEGGIVNGADVLIITDGSAISTPHPFTRVIDMFDGNDAVALEKARARWKDYKASGRKLMYLQQNEQGGWEEKAVA